MCWEIQLGSDTNHLTIFPFQFSLKVCAVLSIVFVFSDYDKSWFFTNFGFITK